MKMKHRFQFLITIMLGAVVVAVLSQQLQLAEAQNVKKATSSETSFLEWYKWKKKYKACSPKHNPFSSPVDIISATAVRVHNLQTLIVYSKAPQENTYLFSTLYDADNVQMESFSIKVKNDDVLRDATYISGQGSHTHRFFKSALIMFRPGPDEPPLHERQGFHTLNQKEYPMEILFNFEAHLNREITQIHVLVELAKQENPAWKPILDMFAGLREKIVQEKCVGDAHLAKAAENLRNSEALYKKALSQQKELTQGSVYTQTLKELEALLGALKDVGEEAMADLLKQRLVAVKNQEKCQQELDVVNEQLLSVANETVVNNTENEVYLTMEAYELIELRQNLTICVEEEGAIADNLQREWSRRDELLKKNRIGNDTTDLFRSVQDLAEFVDKLKEKQAELGRISKAVEEARNVVEELSSIPKRSVIVQDAFQISWLFPSSGGYYFYNGSSPTPPCKRKTDVIVFENRISITEEQLNHFHEFPAFAQNGSLAQVERICELQRQGKKDDSKKIVEIIKDMEKISGQVPSLKALGNRTVWYNPKNIQFLDDDGMHMKSSTRRKLREFSNSPCKIVQTWVIVCAICANFYVV